MVTRVREAPVGICGDMGGRGVRAGGGQFDVVGGAGEDSKRGGNLGGGRGSKVWVRAGVASLSGGLLNDAVRQIGVMIMFLMLIMYYSDALSITDGFALSSCAIIGNAPPEREIGERRHGRCDAVIH